MISCEHIRSLSTPYVDGELPARVRAAVDVHLAACEACREAVFYERDGRAALVDCRASLRAVTGDRAPEHLRRAVEALTRTPASARKERRLARLPVAATIALVCAGVVAYGMFARGATAIAAQLTLDHLKCVRLVSASGVPGPTVGSQVLVGSMRPPDRAVIAVWERTYGWRAMLPEQAAREGFELVALRRCLHGRGFVAHALYRRGDHLVSLFVFADDVQATGVLEIMGERASIWSHGAHTYAVVGAATAGELERFVALTRASLAAPAL